MASSNAIFDFHHQTRDEFLRSIRNLEIEDGLDYIEAVTYNNRSAYSETERKELEQTPISAFYRSYPYREQKFAFVGLVPHTEEDPGEVPSTVLKTLAPATDSIEEFTEACIRDYRENYLTNGNKSRGYQMLWEYLHDQNHILPDVEEFDKSAYARGEYETDPFDDVYFTNKYKMATEGQGGLEKSFKNRTKDLANRSLTEELDLVNPDVVFPASEDVFRGLYPETDGLAVPPSTYKESLPDDIDNSDYTSEIVGFAFESESLSSIIVPTFHPNWWNLHHTEQGDRRLQQTIERL